MSLNHTHTHNDYEKAAQYWRYQYLHIKQALDSLLNYLNNNNWKFNIPQDTLTWFAVDTLDEDAWREGINEEFYQYPDEAELEDFYEHVETPEEREMMDKMIDDVLDAINDMKWFNK